MVAAMRRHKDSVELQASACRAVRGLAVTCSGTLAVVEAVAPAVVGGADIGLSTRVVDREQRGDCEGVRH